METISVRGRMIMPEKRKPKVDLKRNKELFNTIAIFNIMAITAKALNKEGMFREKNEYMKRMCSCNSHDKAIKITREYVEIV